MAVTAHTLYTPPAPCQGAPVPTPPSRSRALQAHTAAKLGYLRTLSNSSGDEASLTASSAVLANAARALDDPAAKGAAGTNACARKQQEARRARRSSTAPGFAMVDSGWMGFSVWVSGGGGGWVKVVVGKSDEIGVCEFGFRQIRAPDHQTNVLPLSQSEAHLLLACTRRRL